MTPEEFRARFPEFRTATDELLDAVLTEAAARIDRSLFGALFGAAVGYLAAHLLEISPFGKNLRISDEKGGPGYKALYEGIRKQVLPHLFVT